MLAEHLRQAAALESVLDGSPAASTLRLELVRAGLQCVEQLLLWGEAERALKLVRRLGSTSVELPHSDVFQVALGELRALSQLRLDHECIDRAHALLETERGSHA